MFNFLKKQDNSTPNELTEFFDTFNQDQKAAIIVALLSISRASTPLLDEEEKHLGATLRNFRMTGSDPTFKRVSRSNSASLVEILNSLNEDQKRWYVLSSHFMVCASGGNDDKFNWALGICEKIGISEDQYIETVKKNEALMRAFKLL